MSDIIVKAASYLGPEGYGNSRTGLKPWPDALARRSRTSYGSYVGMEPR